MTTTKICVDASFIVRRVSAEITESRYRDLWNEWVNSGYEIVAPTLIYYEASNAFHRMSLAGQISAEEAVQLMDNASNLGIVLYGDRFFCWRSARATSLSLSLPGRATHQQALNLASTLRLPASYDAHYLALSQELSALFYTADRRLFNAVSSALNWVRLIG